MLASPAGCYSLESRRCALEPACSSTCSVRSAGEGGGGGGSGTSSAAGMKKPPRRRSAEEGWLRVTLLLSLVGLRLDWDGLSLPPHEKDHHRHQPFSWLREVRALGTPRFPATRLDAWLVQAGGEAVPQTVQPTTSSGEQHLAGASGGGDGSRAEEAAPEPPFSAGEQIRLPRPSGHEEREEGAAAASGESSQVGGEQQVRVNGPHRQGASRWRRDLRESGDQHPH